MSLQSRQAEPATRRTWTTGRVIPYTLAATLLLTVFSGFLPLRWFWFVDYEMARQVLQWDAPFRPNMRMRTKYFEGAEAAMANVRPAEHLGWRNFTTDRIGFRYCPPVQPGRAPDVVVFHGFSFIFGDALSDEQTFPAQLSRRLGRNVYNAARFHGDPDTPADFDRLMAKVGAHPQTAVYVLLEEDELGLSSANLRDDERRRLLHFGKEFPMTWIRMSPVIQVAREAKRSIENDAILHNGFRDYVNFYPLPDGTRLVVRKGYVQRAETNFDEATVQDRCDFVAWWHARMAERGIRMVVLMVPARMSVYGPELGLKVPEDPYLDRMERNLVDRGIRVVNGLPILRATAARDLATGNMAYFREDEHWNAEGVRRLADATANALATPAPVAIESRSVR